MMLSELIVGIDLLVHVCSLVRMTCKGLFSALRHCDLEDGIEGVRHGQSPERFQEVFVGVRRHLRSTQRSLTPKVSPERGLVSGNRWVGRRFVVPQGWGSGCYKVTPELVCYLITFGGKGGRRALYETACVTPGHDCLCSYSYGRGVAVRPQTDDAIWDGVLGLWSSVATLLSPWCARGNVPTGVNLNGYAG